MSKMNILVHLNAYSDSQTSNNPNLNNLKWSRELLGVTVKDPRSESARIAAGTSRTIFNGSRTLAQDETTEYDLTLKSGTSNTYVLEHSGGTAPAFRTRRSIQTSAETTFEVTKNADLVTIKQTSDGGGFLVESDVVPGDNVYIGAPFAAQNQGIKVILALTSDSISFVSADAVAEEEVVLGALYDSNFRIFSAAGVQAGDSLAIEAGFSALSHGSYEITQVKDGSIEFYSTASLPEETNITTNVAVYTDGKRLVYVESNKKIQVTINGGQTFIVQPVVNQNNVSPGMLLLTASVYSLTVQNIDTAEAAVFVACVE
jgi:hypothetical protein